MKIDAIILAGGMGTRLRDAVPDRPKVLATVCGRPFLTHLLDQLAAANFSSVVLSTGYMADRVEQEIGKSYRDLLIRYSRETAPLGTAGAIRKALDFTLSDPVLVMNGDSFCETDFGAFCNFHRLKKSNATLLLTRVENTSRFGRVEVDHKDAVIRFEEKGGRAESGWINAGIYCLAREIIEQIPTDRPISIEREIFPSLIGNRLFAFRTRGDFIDIGTPESFIAAQEFFKRHHIISA